MEFEVWHDNVKTCGNFFVPSDRHAACYQWHHKGPEQDQRKAECIDHGSCDDSCGIEVILGRAEEKKQHEEGDDVNGPAYVEEAEQTAQELTAGSESIDDNHHRLVPRI